MPAKTGFEDLDKPVKRAAFIVSASPLPLARSPLNTMKQQDINPALVEWDELPDLTPPGSPRPYQPLSYWKEVTHGY